MVRDKRRISWIYGWRIKGNFTGIRHYNHYICTQNTKIKFFDYAVSISFCCCCWVAQSCLTLVTPWTAAHQASLSFTDSWSLLKLMSIDSVMPSNHLILCCPFFSCPQSFPLSGSFQLVSSLHQMAKGLELQLQHQSFQCIFRVDFL